MTISPLDLVRAGRWERATFTTFSLSLSFFEGIVLDALVRAGTREALVLADVEGVATALSERGVRRAGRDYEVEPVAVSGGVFHPKIAVLEGEEGPHILVGSGNLTFGGWGTNLEVVEHLHPSFAPSAVLDVASFFEEVASHPRIVHDAAAKLGTLVDRLRLAARPAASRADIRVIHGLSRPIANQIAEFAEDLGGALRLVVVSPYFDVDGSGIHRLLRTLGLQEALVHVHHALAGPGAGTNGWPWNIAGGVSPIAAHPFQEKATRRLHAKAFEVNCAKGRVIVSGSVNATDAALGPGRNVEACVLRVLREGKHRLGLVAGLGAFSSRWRRRQQSGRKSARRASGCSR